MMYIILLYYFFLSVKMIKITIVILVTMVVICEAQNLTALIGKANI